VPVTAVKLALANAGYSPVRGADSSPVRDTADPGARGLAGERGRGGVVGVTRSS
jgi:hypothetical protein